MKKQYSMQRHLEVIGRDVSPRTIAKTMRPVNLAANFETDLRKISFKLAHTRSRVGILLLLEK